MFPKSSHLTCLLLSYYLIQINGQKQSCLSSKTKPIPNSGSLTNYEEIRGSNIEIPKNCKPIYLWSLTHTLEEEEYTHPKAEENLPKTQAAIIKNHDEKRDTLCDEEVAKLKEWTRLKMNISDDLLTYIRSNTKNWVERLKRTFDNDNDIEQLLKKPTAGEQPFEIQSANTKEAKASASEMTRILYGSETSNNDNQYIVDNDELLQMGEYFLDITSYYAFGPENPNAANMGCSIVQTLLNNLTNAAQNEIIRTKASFFSSSTSVFVGAVVKLGLFQDERFPDPDDDDVTISNRKWKTSFIMPSSANLIAALYKCPQNVSEPRVAFFFNEKPISMPGCDENLCSLDFLRKKHADVFLPNQCGTKYCYPIDY